MFLQQVINGLMAGSMYSLVAVGYTLIFGLLNLMNLAHGEVFMAAGFIGLFFLVGLKTNIYITVGAAIIGAGLIGLLIELICFRYVKKEYPMAPFLGTIGFGTTLTNLIVNLAGSEPSAFPAVLKVPDFEVQDLLISSVQLLILGIAIVLMVGLTLLIGRTRLGRSMRAIAENLVASHLLGINVTRVIVLAFFISSAVAGIAGILMALRFGQISPFIGGHTGMKGIAVMVIGGLGNVQGAMITGIIVGLVEVLVMAYGSASYVDAFVWGLLILTLLFKPSGLFGTTVRT